MANRLDLDDLQIFLAVARAGRFTAASNRVKLDHSTTARRIDRLESALGVKLFNRSPMGVTLTGEGMSILTHAERIESIIVDGVEELTDFGDEPGGPVRLALPEELAVHIVTHFAQRFRQMFPGICLDIRSESAIRSENESFVESLLKRETDVLVSSIRPVGHHIRTRRLFDAGYGFFSSQPYMARRGMPRTLAEVANHDLVLEAGAVFDGPHRLLLDTLLPAKAVVLRSRSTTAQQHAIAAGCGVGLLPLPAAAADPRLVPLLPAAVFVRRYWITCRTSQLRLRRIRATTCFLQMLVRDQRELLTGETAPAGTKAKIGKIPVHEFTAQVE